jgi:hypothetical protein
MVPLTLLPCVGWSTATAFSGTDDFSSGACACAVIAVSDKKINAISEIGNGFIQNTSLHHAIPAA